MEGFTELFNNINEMDEEVILDVRGNNVTNGSVSNLMEGYSIEELTDYAERKKDNILIKFDNIKEIDVSGLFEKRL